MSVNNKIDNHVKRIIGMYAPNNLIDQYADLFYEYLDKYMAKHKSKYNTEYDYLDKVKQLASVWIQSKINLNLFESRKVIGEQKMKKLVITQDEIESVLSEAGERAYEKYGDDLTDDDISDALEDMYNSGWFETAYTPEELKEYAVEQFTELPIEALNDVDWDSLFHKLAREENFQELLNGYLIEDYDLYAMLEAYL